MDILIIRCRIADEVCDIMARPTLLSEYPGQICYQLSKDNELIGYVCQDKQGKFKGAGSYNLTPDDIDAVGEQIEAQGG